MEKARVVRGFWSSSKLKPSLKEGSTGSLATAGFQRKKTTDSSKELSKVLKLRTESLSLVGLFLKEYLGSFVSWRNLVSGVPYEITTFTSDISGAATDSDIFTVVYGEEGCTDQHLLEPNKSERKKVFKQGEKDTFILEVPYFIQ